MVFFFFFHFDSNHSIFLRAFLISKKKKTIPRRWCILHLVYFEIYAVKTVHNAKKL